MEKFGTDCDATVSVLEEAQKLLLRMERLQRKKVHGKFWKELAKTNRKTEECCRWLTHLTLSANTEATVAAIQDGSVVTRNYRRRIFHHAETNLCRNGCKEPETLPHILSMCTPYEFTYYKERHDSILLELIKRVAKRYEISLPIKSLVEDAQVKPMVLEDRTKQVHM